MIKNKKGFTLIELLVVVSIMGLLGSIILVTANDSTKKANLSKRLQFSASIRGFLTDKLKGEWTFNDGTKNDSSPFHMIDVFNDGSTIINDGIDKQALKLGGCAVIKCLSPSNWGFSSGAFSFELWLRPIDSNMIIANFVTTGFSNLSYNSGAKTLTFNLTTEAEYCSLAVQNFSILPDEWNHLAGAYNNNNGKLELFLNTKLVGSKNCQPSPVKYSLVNPNIIPVGSPPMCGVYEFLSIDEIRIYDGYFSVF